MDFRPGNTWIAAYVLWIVFVLSQGQSNSDKALFVARSGDAFGPGMLQVYPGSISELADQTFLGTEPTYYSLNYEAYETEVTSIANDPFNSTLYYSEADTRSIYRINGVDLQFANPNITFTKIHEGLSEQASNIAFDWLTKTVYWTDHHYGWIALQPSFVSDPTMFKILIEDLVYPVGLALDPIVGFMFWFDANAGSGRIERATMAGKARTNIGHTSLGYVVDIAVDPTEQRIYYIDSERMVIEHMSYYGGQRAPSRHLTGYTLGSLAVTRDEVCIAEPELYFVACFLKADTSNNFFQSYWWNAPRAISIYDDSFLITDQSDACKNHTCEHICAINSTTTHVCLCKQGYTLNSDNSTCTADHYLFHKGILITNGTHICMTEVRSITGGTLKPVCLNGNFTQTRHLAADARDSIVFYYDEQTKEISAHGILTDTTTLLASAGNVTGLVYDWITKNLFWAEADTGSIHVVNVNNKATYKLYANITGLGPIALSPHNKTLFWMSYSANGVSIYAGSLNGTSSKVIVKPEEVFSPTAMYADPSTGRLFYLDFFTLTAVDPYNISEPVILFSSVNTFDLIIYKRYALWINSLDGFLYGSSYLDYTKETQLHDSEFGRVLGVAVFDVSLQKLELGPCNKVPNGGCGDICLPTETGPVCKCGFGTTLKDDNKTCISTPLEDNFIVITDVSNSKIFQVSQLDGNNFVSLNIPSSMYVTGSMYHKTEKMVYFTESATQSIVRMYLDGSNLTTVVQFSGVNPERLTVDYSTGHVYYGVSDSFTFFGGYIGVYDPVKMVHKTLVENLDFPRGLAVFPSEGLMFVADYGSFSSTIESIYMDGTNRNTIVQSSEIGSPTGLAIDYTAKRIYWADYYYDTIESCDLAGNNRNTFKSHTMGFLSDVAIQGNFIYYTGMNINRVVRVNKTNGFNVIFMDPTPELGAVETISIHPGDPQPLNSACADNNGGCSTFCTPVPYGRTCGCENGVELLEDGRHCQGVKETCTKHIPFGELTPDRHSDDCSPTDGRECCYAIEGYKCRVGCAEGYRRNSSHTFDKIQCLSTGLWDHAPESLCEPVTCPATVSNGKIAETCDRSINSVCNVECAPNYVNAPQGMFVRCQKNGFWSPDSGSVCRPVVRCTEPIANGMLGPNCTETSASCDIRCNPNFRLSSLVRSVHCRSDGTLSVHVGEVCEPIMCPSTIDNVQLETGCQPNAGTECSYTCRDGYTPADPLNRRVTCQSTGSWSRTSAQLCKAIMCAEQLPNVILPQNSLREAGKHFTFSCSENYVKNTDVKFVTCMSTGSWSVSASGLCSAPIVQSSPQSQTQSIGQGIGYGILVAVCVVLILLAIAYVLYRKRTSNKARFVESPNVQFSTNTRNEFHNPSAEITGVTNPNPYATLGAATTNPYDNLSEQKTVEMNGSGVEEDKNQYHRF